MSQVLLYYAHPGHRFSRVNKALLKKARTVADLTIVDLYGEYPRHDIDVDKEQERLLSHDVIIFQHPLFWYSTPSVIKEWQDLVLEHGFAYGADGDKLRGKTLMQAIAAAGPEDAYSEDGYQNFRLRTFLAPMEQTANLCKMHYAPPYVLYGALKAPAEGEVGPHADGYERLLSALRDDRFDFQTASGLDALHHDKLPLLESKQ